MRTGLLRGRYYILAMNFLCDVNVQRKTLPTNVNPNVVGLEYPVRNTLNPVGHGSV